LEMLASPAINKLGKSGPWIYTRHYSGATRVGIIIIVRDFRKTSSV
jgi:hypothetical protein